MNTQTDFEEVRDRVGLGCLKKYQLPQRCAVRYWWGIVHKKIKQKRSLMFSSVLKESKFF